MRFRILPVLLLVALACAKSAPSHSPTPLSGQAADQITDLVTDALKADARLERADSLYDPAALLIADGNRRGGVPRYAGITGGGNVEVGSSQVEVAQGFAWVYAEYRCVAPASNLARDGRVTVIMTRSEAGTWRIVHAHSSSGD
jgi:ketosteroid isomerase-like protein